MLILFCRFDIANIGRKITKFQLFASFFAILLRQPPPNVTYPPHSLGICRIWGLRRQ